MERQFPETLSALRRERQLSQRTAAAALGISQALLSHYENGAREPGLGFVCRACDYYGMILDSDSNPTFTDRLNAGHTALAMGRIAEAIDHYQIGQKLTPGGKTEFLAAYTADMPALLAAQVDETTIRLIPEVLRLHPL